MAYKFTNKMHPQVCRICGYVFDRRWSAGGIGAVCEKCAPIKDKIDLVEAGIIRNIVPTHSEHHSNNTSFTFEAKIDDKWYSCSGPCGNWSFVYGYPEKHDIFSVPVGWWELNDLYNKYN